MAARTYEEVELLCQVLGLRCTPKFAEPIISGAREKILFGGWRAAKTVRDCLIAMLLIMDWLEEHQSGKSRHRLIWLVGPDYKQTAEEYRYLAEWCGKLQMLAQPASTAVEGPRQLLLTHDVLIETKSADRPETLASVAPDAIFACEPGQTSEEVRDMLRGRAGEKNAPLVWGGTVENDDGKPQWAWYQELAREWLDNPTPRHQAWELPTWDNPLWDDCTNWVEEDPSLAVYCPDSNHGPAHGGRIHPIIKQWEENLDSFTFARRIAAIPTGPQYVVYEQTVSESLLQPIPQSALKGFYFGTGGIDYGWAQHPSVLAVVQYTEDPRDKQPSFVGPKGIAWVREVRYLDSDPGDKTALERARKDLWSTWNCWRWNVDPMQVYMAKSMDPTLTGTSYSESRRLARIGLLQGRFNYRKLFFDLNGPGVARCYKEFQHYHYKKNPSGKMELVRDADDGVAAVEDAIEAFDGSNTPYVAPRMPKRVFSETKTRQFARRT